MAHFRATIKGQRGEASRLGSPNSGLTVTANGWNVGVKVEALVSANGSDTFAVYATGGSNATSSPRLIAVIEHGKVSRP